MADGGGKAAADRRGLGKGLGDATLRVLLARGVDRAGVPTGMHQARTAGVDEQGQLIEPVDERVPVARVLGKLGEGFVDEARMAWCVLTHERLATARQRRGHPAQGAVFVVAHDAERLPRLDHAMDDMQGLANAWAAVDDVAQEQRLAPRVAPYAADALVTEGIEQAFQGVGTAVNVADEGEAGRRIGQQSSLPPRRVPQPSLVRQTS